MAVMHSVRCGCRACTLIVPCTGPVVAGAGAPLRQLAAWHARSATLGVLHEPLRQERHAWAREAGGAQDRVRVRSLSLQGTSNWACLMLLMLPPGAKLMWERREQQEAAPPWAPSRASLRNHNPGCASEP